MAAAMNQSNRLLSDLSRNKVDPQLDESCGSQGSGSEGGSKACFSLPVLLRDPPDQLDTRDPLG